MARGKQTCKILKEIRRQIAEANDIEFMTSECRYKGDCLGTCPKCEAEVQYLERQLRKRQLAGKLINLAGISAGALAMLTPMAAQSRTLEPSLPIDSVETQSTVDTILVKGVVFEEDTLPNGTISREPLIGVTILQRETRTGALTDLKGEFQLKVCKGATLEIRYVGYKDQKIVVMDDSPLEIRLQSPNDYEILGEIPVVRQASSHKPKNVLDLRIVDEDKKPLPEDSVTIERVYIDEDGEEDTDEIYPRWMEEKGLFRINWNEYLELIDDDDKPLKEATLRITAEGYDDPITINVKYPKRNTKKTIKFTHSKKK